ncbi:hypothetical protein PR048_013473 [Dryococelus australis]|uniref:Uncharacterized protein n=1 Tax=Dryococelus australis TaxID=614101 RepID=A0ABQ9HTS2_9NEOP|nr:hypothetical protein PR048_013473 [Dryococelus australis]
MRHRNEREGETGYPRENLPTSDIVQHDSHIQKSWGRSRQESNLVRLETFRHADLPFQATIVEHIAQNILDVSPHEPDTHNVWTAIAAKLFESRDGVAACNCQMYGYNGVSGLDSKHRLPTAEKIQPTNKPIERPGKKNKNASSQEHEIK